MLMLSRVVIAVFTMRRITTRLGIAKQETLQEELPQHQVWKARRIRRAIRKAAPHTPTESNCYPQALTAYSLLRAARIPTTVYYGAAFAGSKDSLETHVWVRSGTDIVTGGPHHRGFGVLASFAWVPSGSAMRTTTLEIGHPRTDSATPPA